MNEIEAARDAMTLACRSMFDRGLTGGSSGNVSARLSDGSLLVTPTGCSFGRLNPAQVSHLDAAGTLLSGDPPTKELPLHRAFYQTRPETGAVVHLHATHSVALSMLPELDPDHALPPLTPYAIMRLGKVKLLPFFVPGDPAMGDAITALAGRHSAVLLANHGPVVAGADLDAAVYAMEELEETARLALLLRGTEHRPLTPAQVAAVVQRYDVPWE